MRKLIVVAAMLAMALLVAAPAVMAQTADLSQQNTGDVISTNVSDQNATQRQFAPGGDAQYNVEGDDEVEEENENITILDEDDEDEAEPPPVVTPPVLLTGGGLQPQDDDDDFDVVIIEEENENEEDNDVNQYGGDGGTQTLDQNNTQHSTATGATFGAVQG